MTPKTLIPVNPCGVTANARSACSMNLSGTGVIRNTANGTGLAYQIGSDAVTLLLIFRRRRGLPSADRIGRKPSET